MSVMKLENAENTPPSGDARVDFPNELNEPRWSIVSFEKSVASNLTYEQAANKSSELAAQKVPGLCIITDEAARRIAG